MATTDVQGQLFAREPVAAGVRLFSHGRCRLQTEDGYRVLSVCGIVVAHYRVGDAMSEAWAMVRLVDQGWASQKEVAQTFGCCERTVRRHQRRFEAGGLAALGRASGYPKGRRRLPSPRVEKVGQWKEHGVFQREMARRLGVSEKAVRKLLRRLGWKPELPEQLLLLEAGTVGDSADPNLSGSAPAALGEGREKATAVAAEPAAQAPAAQPTDADPNLSGFPLGDDDWLPRSHDLDARDRSIDRLLACLGLLDDAAPLFAAGRGVLGLGALLAVPALLESGVFQIAREVYGSLGPAFYGLRTTLLTLLLMALLRIRRPEGLKERSPQQLGQILGLDRAPEVKTLRNKLARLASFGRAADFGRALAAHRVAQRGHAMDFLYIDGHVRAYHGQRTLPKTHVARMRLSLPATTDYWVNDAEGEPLFFVTSEANRGLVQMLPEILAEIRSLLGNRRVTVVFDRGGWSPKLFQKLLAEGFDLLTYRKGRSRRVAKSRFSPHEATLDGQKVRYLLADQTVLLLKRKLRLRQVTRLSPNGHQTPILTSRWDLKPIEIAHRMFERWRQENFFKYLREEYALDALVDYGLEPAEPTRSVPNPKRKQIDAQIQRARTQLAQLEKEYGLEALANPEARRRTMRGFKIANAKLAQRIRDAMKRLATLEKKRARIPARVPVQEVVEGDIIQLATERKHLTDLLKMVAYQAEGDLLRAVEPHYRRSEDEGRTLIQSALASTGDLNVHDTELHIALQPLSSPHRTRALAALCEHLNAQRACYPGTALRLCFSVQSEPSPSMAFPGAKPQKIRSEPPRPDSLGLA